MMVEALISGSGGFDYFICQFTHVKKLWTSMHNSAYNCDFKNLIAPLNSLGTLEIYQVIKTANYFIKIYYCYCLVIR